MGRQLPRDFDRDFSRVLHLDGAVLVIRRMMSMIVDVATTRVLYAAVEVIGLRSARRLPGRFRVIAVQEVLLTGDEVDHRHGDGAFSKPAEVGLEDGCRHMRWVFQRLIVTPQMWYQKARKELDIRPM